MKILAGFYTPAASLSLLLRQKDETISCPKECAKIPATGQRFTIADIRRLGDGHYYYMSNIGECNAKGASLVARRSSGEWRHFQRDGRQRIWQTFPAVALVPYYTVPSMRLLPIATLVLLATSFVSCSREKTCTASTTNRPGFGIFVGFAAQETDTVIVQHFAVGNNFRQPLATDTFTASDLYTQNDTVRQGSFYYTPVRFSWDAETAVILPATGKTYYIRNVARNRDSSYTYKTMGSCRKTPVEIPPQTIEIGGISFGSSSGRFALRK